MASTIVINGKRITVEGNNISIHNGVVKVDGKVIEDGLSGTVVIKWEGPLANLTTDTSVHCGDVAGNVSAGSSVSCHTVGKNVSAGSSVDCDDVGGNVSAGSSVDCGDVDGNVTAGSRATRNK